MKSYLWLGLTCLLCSCGSIREVQNNSTWQAQTVNTISFDASGRVGVKIQSSGYSAGFDWLRTQQMETFDINSPLGNTLVQICQDTQGAIARDINGKIHQAKNVEQLSLSTLGEVFPVQHLAVWANGQWLDGVPYQLEKDGSLMQLGWKITREVDETQQLKSLTVRNDKLSMQMIFHQFSFNPTLPEQYICELRNEK